MTLRVFAYDNFIDKTVSHLLRAKLADHNVIVSFQYNSSEKFNRILSRQKIIRNIELKAFEPKNSKFTISIAYDNGNVDNLSGVYTPHVMIPVAAKYIQYGQVIQSMDIKMLKVKLNFVHNDYATNIDDVVGMKSKQYIKIGEVFKLSKIIAPPVIKKYDPVQIVYTSGAINLKTSGEALAFGAIGNMIKAKNITSGAIVLGKVINNNTIQVNNDQN